MEKTDSLRRSTISHLSRTASHAPSTSTQQSKKAKSSKSSATLQNSRTASLQSSEQIISQKETYSEGNSIETSVSKTQKEKNGACECSPGLYSRILGPTADETILTGLQTVIDLCNKLRVCGDNEEEDDEQPEKEEEIPVKDSSNKVKNFGSQTELRSVSAAFQVSPNVKPASSQTSTYAETVVEVLQRSGLHPEMVSRIIQTSFTELFDRPSLTSANVQTSFASSSKRSIEQVLHPNFVSSQIQTSPPKVNYHNTPKSVKHEDSQTNEEQLFSRYSSSQTSNPNIYSSVTQTTKPALRASMTQTIENVLPTIDEKPSSASEDSGVNETDETAQQTDDDKTISSGRKQDNDIQSSKKHNDQLLYYDDDLIQNGYKDKMLDETNHDNDRIQANGKRSISEGKTEDYHIQTISKKVISDGRTENYQLNNYDHIQEPDTKPSSDETEHSQLDSKEFIGAGGDEHKCISPPEPPDQSDDDSCICSSSTSQRSSKRSRMNLRKCTCQTKKHSKCKCKHVGHKKSRESMKSQRETPIEVKYALTKILKFKEFTTFEVMKSTRNPPRQMPKGIEGVFVLRQRKGETPSKTSLVKRSSKEAS